MKVEWGFYRKIISLIFVFFQLTSFFAQQVQSIVTLENTLSESSGLLYLDQKIITHNDSQGEPALYEIDTLTGNFSRKIVVANASNSDWEDLAYDSTYIYIGDFGNNYGNRTNLIIYRISLYDYWNTTNDTVFADTIRFNYAAQTNFSSQLNATNYDCEAMTIIGDSIYLFSKNWINQKSYVYSMPRAIGNYPLTIRDSLPIQGLITSADYNQFENRLVLTGYTPTGPFIVEMDWNTSLTISQRSRNRYPISVQNSIQVEAIATVSSNQYYLTAELFWGNEAGLVRLTGLNGSTGIEEGDHSNYTVFPNPTLDWVQVEGNKVTKIELFSVDGKYLKSTNSDRIDLFEFPSGVYWLKIDFENNSSPVFKKIVH